MTDTVHIIGGGIIGAASAYYLSLRGVKTVIIEECRIGAAASGKAGGFLGSSWGDGTSNESLHRNGFELHKELAKTLNVESFRHIHTVGVERRRGGHSKDQYNVSWVNKSTSTTRMMDESSAQVTPLELTEKLVAAANATVVLGKLEEVNHREDGRYDLIVSSHNETIVASHVVFAMGPWSVALEKWFGLRVPMEGIKSTSLEFTPTEALEDPVATFCHEDENGCHLEVFPRPNKDIYICGVGGSDNLNANEIGKVSADQVVANESRINAACKSFRRMFTTPVDETNLKVKQACLRPCPVDAIPMIGRLELGEKKNLFLATGHNCWGILWGPITGKIVSELVLDEKVTCVPDISTFNPHRFGLTEVASLSERGRHQENEAVGEQW